MFARRNAPRRRNKQLGFVATGLGGAGPNFGSGGRFNVQQWLFGSGEQGGWWDPSDLTTMFQDSAGTTPVTAVGQPVGMILDKRLGAVRGAELLVDTTFDDASKWSLIQPTAGTTTISGGVLTLNTTDGTNTYATPNPALVPVVGQWYEMTAEVTSLTGVGVSLYIGSVETTFTTTGLKRTILRATTADPPQFKRMAGGATTATITSVSIKAIPGNHRTQATAASRPTLRQDASGYYYLEYDGVDDSMATGSVDFSGTDKMTVWAGVNKQSDAAAGIFVELTSGIGANNGAFTLAAPNGAAANNFSWASKGTAQASCVTGAFYASPSAVVIAAEADIANDICRQRVSGTAITNSGVDQGTGSFSNAALYFGRRGGSSLPFNGREYQTIIRGAATDTILLANAERFIGSKMGIAL